MLVLSSFHFHKGSWENGEVLCGLYEFGVMACFVLHCVDGRKISPERFWNGWKDIMDSPIAGMEQQMGITAFEFWTLV